MPLLGIHAGKHRVGVDAGVIDENLDRAGFQQFFQCGGGGRSLGDVEGDSLGTAAGSDDVGDDRFRLFDAAVGMDDDVMAVGGQAAADRRADAAAAAGDEGAFDRISFWAVFSG